MALLFTGGLLSCDLLVDDEAAPLDSPTNGSSAGGWSGVLYDLEVEEPEGGDETINVASNSTYTYTLRAYTDGIIPFTSNKIDVTNQCGRYFWSLEKYERGAGANWQPVLTKQINSFATATLTPSAPFWGRLFSFSQRG